jgi:chromosome segregation protein
VDLDKLKAELKIIQKENADYFKENRDMKE